MVTILEPCSCLAKTNTQITSFLIGCCQKEQKVTHEEEHGFELEFKFLNGLPDHILLEILLRLPAKPVCRYKVVSKPWCSLISSSHFISRFINLRNQREPRNTGPETFTLVFQHEIKDAGYHRLEPIDAVSNHPRLFKLFNKKSVNLNFLPTVRPKDVGREIIYPASEPIRVRASCQDLLLCSYFRVYYVVNLLTSQWIALPTCPRLSVEGSPSFRRLFVDQKHGLLCYHDPKDINGNGWYRFKVILFPLIPHSYSPENLETRNIRVPPELLSSKFKVQVYSSETTEWTEVIVDWYPLQLNAYLRSSPILAFDGMLHWLNGRSLVSLDPFSGDAKLNLSHVVKLPDEFVQDSWSCFGASVGRLRIACRVPGQSGLDLHVWELEDRSSRSWLLVHKVELRKLATNHDGFRAVAFHPYKRDIILLKYREYIYLYNIRTGRHKLFRKVVLGKGWKCCLSGATVVPPLVHQWFPTPVPSPLAVQGSG